MTAAQAAENHGNKLGLFGLILSMRDIYINSNQYPKSKFTSSNRSTDFKYTLWNISQMVKKTVLENNHKQCDETGHPVVNMMESQCKLRQQHDQDFPMEEKPL